MNQNKNQDPALSYSREHQNLTPVEMGRIAMRNMDTFPAEGRGEPGFSLNTNKLKEVMLSDATKHEDKRSMTGFVKRVTIVNDRHQRIRHQ